MKNSSKWILVIAAVFVVAFFIGAAAFFRIGYRSMGMMPRIELAERLGALRPDSWGWRRMPMVGGLYPWRWIGGGLRGLLGIGVIILAALGVAGLLQRKAPLHANPTRQPQPVATPDSASAATVQPAVVTCESCQRELQPDWVACPFCGTLKKTT